MLEKAYTSLGLGGDLPAAQHAYEQVRIAEPVEAGKAPTGPSASSVIAPVATVLGHNQDIPATLRTGSWSNQVPVYSEHSAPCNLACPVCFADSSPKRNSHRSLGDVERMLDARAPGPRPTGRLPRDSAVAVERCP